MSLDPNNITLNKTSKLFEFEKQSRAIDDMDDIKLVKDLLKCYIKLYLKQQETLSIIGPPPNDLQLQINDYVIWTNSLGQTTKDG